MNTRVKADIVAHTHAMPGEEVCGLVYHTESSVHAFPCRNVSPEPHDSFEIDPSDYATAAGLGRVCAIYHGGSSHTNEGFSEADLETAREMCLPLHLCAASGKWATYVPETYRVEPTGLVWIWGQWDCYETIRLHYRQTHGIYLTDYDRDESFEHAEESAITRHIADEGFVYVPKDQPIVTDDVLLFRTYGSAYPHHLAVVTGPNQMLHHRRHHLSSIDPIDGAWLRRLVGVLRYQCN
jgi:proteasome lid subunit RPN8/RPN11